MHPPSPSPGPELLTPHLAGAAHLGGVDRMLLSTSQLRRIDARRTGFLLGVATRHKLLDRLGDLFLISR